VFDPKDYFWQQVGEDLSSALSADDFITGKYISLSGDGKTLAISSYGYDDEDMFSSGLVQMYRWSNGL